MTPAPSQINRQLDRIEEAIIGDGREGLLTRTARIEEKLETAARLAGEAKTSAEHAAEVADSAVTRAADAVNKLALIVTRLEEITKQHLGTDHLSVLIKKKEFWAAVVVGFVVLHLISTYVPSMWDAIMVFVGIPKLIVPIIK